MSSTHYNQTTISRKIETPFTILHQLSKSSLYLRHTVLKKRKRNSPCSASHSLSRKWNGFTKSPPCLEPQSLQSGRRKNIPHPSLLLLVYLSFHFPWLFSFITDSWRRSVYLPSYQICIKLHILLPLEWWSVKGNYNVLLNIIILFSLSQIFTYSHLSFEWSIFKQNIQDAGRIWNNSDSKNRPDCGGHN